MIIRALWVSDRLGLWPAEVKAAIVGATVGTIDWFAPGLIGAGEITQHVLPVR